MCPYSYWYQYTSTALMNTKLAWGALQVPSGHGTYLGYVKTPTNWFLVVRFDIYSTVRTELVLWSYFWYVLAGVGKYHHRTRNACLVVNVSVTSYASKIRSVTYKIQDLKSRNWPDSRFLMVWNTIENIFCENWKYTFSNHFLWK